KINATLADAAGLRYTPNANFSDNDTLTVLSNDLGHTGAAGALTDSDPISITVTNNDNDPPVNSVPGNQTTNEDTPLVFSAGNGNEVSVSDPDAGSLAVQVTLSVTNGTLTLSGTSGLTFSDGDGSADVSMTFTGSLSAINTALAGMSYTPSPNYN